MDFHTYFTVRDSMLECEGRKYGKQREREWRKTDPTGFYYRALTAIYSGNYNFPDGAYGPNSVHYMVPECCWYLQNKPYYRIYPDYVEMFSGTKLSIPVKYLTAPYDAFVVRFGRGSEPTSGKVKVRSLLFSIMDATDMIGHLEKIRQARSKNPESFPGFNMDSRRKSAARSG